MALVAALDRLDRYVHEAAREWAIPGLAVAVTDRARTLCVFTYGHADITAGTPVTAQTLFEIGSISKSLAVLAVLREVEAGRLSLQAPVIDYLPWLPVRTARKPVTLHHLLSHTGGLPPGIEATPSTLGEALRLARIELEEPGRFRYSNLGYSIVGLVLEHVSGASIGEVLRECVLQPAGMAASEAVITGALRGRLAVGYAAADGWRPWRPGLPLAPATWVESDSAAGSISSTAEDMASYARLLLNRGAGIVDHSSFERMTTAVGRLEDGSGYGYGLRIDERGGRRMIGHGGGMIGFSSALDVDPEAGLGVIALCNMIDLAFPAAKIMDAALSLLRAARDGAELPEPAPEDRGSVPDAADYAGSYRSRDGGLVVHARGDRLTLSGRDPVARLERVEGDVFYPVTAEPAPFLIRFGRAGGKVVELSDGPLWYAGERYDGPTSFTVPEEWRAYPGVYASFSPWVPGFRVFIRKDRLVALAPPGIEAALEPLGESRFRVVDGGEVLPSQIAFGDVIQGRAARATCDGAELYRTSVT
jgi:D-alanyl-D-alanine carboxypeptidase